MHEASEKYWDEFNAEDGTKVSNGTLGSGRNARQVSDVYPAGENRLIR
jgi:hypothetical protein